MTATPTAARFSGETAFHAGVDEGGEGGVVGGDAQAFEVVQGIPHPLGCETGRHHQLVGGDAFIGVRLEQRLADAQQLLPVMLRDVGSGQPDLRGFDGADPQGGGEHLHPVLLACQQERLLQPRHRRAHPGVDGLMHRMGWVPVAGESQEDVAQAEPPIARVRFRRRRNVASRRFPPTP